MLLPHELCDLMANPSIKTFDLFNVVNDSEEADPATTSDGHLAAPFGKL